MRKLIAAGAAAVIGLAALAALIGGPWSASLLCQTASLAGKLPAGIGPDQLTNAATIIRAGQDRHLPQRAWTIAVATALQESGLRNIPFGDRDSLGLFQQRPSQAWGTPAQLMDPYTAATTFYDRLASVANWPGLPLASAAQAVQHSAYPAAYARWEPVALAVIAAVAGLVCDLPGAALFAGVTLGERAVNAAATYLGTPYAWGGGDLHGPTRGFCAGINGFSAGRCLAAATTGFDCSGLAAYAWYQATGGAVRLDHNAARQWTHGQHIARDQLHPGDLLFFSVPGNPLHHVGLYAGGGRMLHAPRTGQAIQITENVFSDPYWGPQYAGALRPAG